jgi:hypothetical protein
MLKKATKLILICIGILLSVGVSLLVVHSYLNEKQTSLLKKELTTIQTSQKNAIQKYYSSIEKTLAAATSDESFINEIYQTESNLEKLFIDKLGEKHTLFISYIITDGYLNVINTTSATIKKGAQLHKQPFESTNLAKTAYESYIFSSNLFSSYFSTPQTSEESLFYSTPLIEKNTFKGLLITQIAIHGSELLEIPSNIQYKWFLTEQFENKIKIIASNFQLIDIKNESALPKNILEELMVNAQDVKIFEGNNQNTTLASIEAIPELNWGIINTTIIEGHNSWTQYIQFLGKSSLYLALSVLMVMILFHSGSYLYVHRNNPKNYHLRIATKISLLLFSLIVISLFLGYYIRKYELQEEVIEKKQEQSKTLSLQKKAQAFDYELFNLENQLKEFSKNINFTTNNNDSIYESLQHFIEENSTAIGTTVAYFDNEKKQLKAPTIIKLDNQIKKLDFAELYDFSKEINDPGLLWYNQANLTNNSWQKPHITRLSPTPIITYALRKDSDSSLVLGTLFSLEFIEKMTADIHENLNGITLLIDKNGEVLYTGYAGKPEFNKVIPLLDQEIFQNIKTLTLKNRHGYYNIPAKNKQLDTWIQPLIHNDWNFVTISVKTDNKENSLLVSLHILLIAIWTMFILIASVMILTAFSPQASLISSIAISSIFTIGTLLIWQTFLQDNKKTPKSFNEIITSNDIENYKDFIKQYSNENNTKYLLIPTSVTITGIQLGDDGSLEINGIITQHIDHETLKKIKPSIRIADAKKQQFSPAFINQNAQYDSYTWNFLSKHSADLDYSLFPLDVQNIEIRIENTDQSQPNILIPMLNNYDIFSGNNSVGGYTVNDAQIGYNVPDINNPDPEEANLPLTVNINLKRNILYSFSIYFMPLLTILLSLFGTNYLFQFRRIDDALSAIACYITILFSLVIIHQSIRAKIVASDIVYIEYLIFISYAVNIGFIALCLWGSHDETKHRRIFNNFIYWPALTGLWFILTTYIFYNF